MNSKIIYNMECLLKINKSLNEKWKVKAYHEVLKKLKDYDLEIHTVDDIHDMNIGKGIKDKITFIIETGKDLPQVSNNDIKKDDIIDSLSTIHNIGVVKAKQLLDVHNISSIEELKHNTHLLNEKQIQGLKYHEDIHQQIPRFEMIEHDEYIRSIFETSFIEIKDFCLVGSYRRGMSDSGDIDLIVSCSSKLSMKELVNTMTEQDYILEDGVFALGKKKFMGMCRLPFKTARRLDILFCSALEYPYALLYFTGNKEFNVKMREHAKNLGFTLNEKGLWMNEVRVKFLKSEKDIFDHLKITYLEPHERCYENFSSI